ncbi:hypothetical protein [Streptomyces alanosinicus]|uniref:Secreted protein n=1 Tax=Streptomyces alanosinicus TaxID=68171 RepID=A0A918YM27_9ACTN|nr:hypothetical protein [Streptomyces alanosinicus]GHE09076.1 hypothetical protein GCM10010339_60220 [Streptomyces alanosinicus]
MSIRRKAGVAVSALALAGAGLAMAAPAHAIGGVTCPTNGLIVMTTGPKNYCAAGSIGYKTTSQLFDVPQITKVVKEHTEWNWAQFYNEFGVVSLKPGQDSQPLGNQMTFALEIDNPGWT